MYVHKQGREEIMSWRGGEIEMEKNLEVDFASWPRRTRKSCIIEKTKNVTDF